MKYWPTREDRATVITLRPMTRMSLAFPSAALHQRTTSPPAQAIMAGRRALCKRATLLGLMLILLAGCPEEAQRVHVSKDQTGFIAFVGRSADDPYWPVLEATALRYRDVLGDFELRTAAPVLASPSAQIRLLRDMHTPEMRGLCIHPADDGIMREILADLRFKGVAIVTMLTRIEHRDPFLHAGADDFAAGEMMANAVARAMPNGGNLAILHDHDLEADSRLQGRRPREDRYLGLKQRFEQLPTLNILREMNCKDNAFVATRIVREYIERFPRLGAWVSTVDWPLRDLPPGESLLPDTCTMVTYGPFPRNWPRITDGTCSAIIGSRYDKVAEAALRMAATAARGDVLANTTYLAPPVMVTSRNLNRFRLRWFRWMETPAMLDARTVADPPAAGAPAP